MLWRVEQTMTSRPNTRAKSKISGDQFAEFAATRRSTRDFLPTPIPQDVLDEILRDAMSAPSWSNTKPILVAVASGEKRDRLSADFMAHWKAVQTARSGGLLPKLRLLVTRFGLPSSNAFIAKPYVKELLPRAQRVGKEMLGSLGVARGDTAARNASWAKNYEFFGAPTELFIFAHKSLGVFSANDAGLFVQNLMLSAHARGLGTCAQGALSTWDNVVRKEFDVPEGYRFLYGIAIGYPSDAPINDFGAHRLDIDEIVLR
jgi:nitroreductase